MFIFCLINRLYRLLSIPWKGEKERIILKVEKSVSQELLDIFKEEYKKRKGYFPNLYFCFAPKFIENIIELFPKLIIVPFVITLDIRMTIIFLIIFGIWIVWHKPSNGFVQPDYEIIYVKQRKGAEETLIHECVHLTAYGYVNGSLRTGFFKNESWRIFNEVITEYIAKCYGLNVSANHIHSQYAAPYERVKTFIEKIGKEKFIQMYYSNDCETIEEWFEKYSTKYSLDEFLNAFTSYRDEGTFAYDIIHTCMNDIQDDLKDKEKEKWFSFSLFIKHNRYEVMAWLN